MSAPWRSSSVQRCGRSSGCGPGELPAVGSAVDPCGAAAAVSKDVGHFRSAIRCSERFQLPGCGYHADAIQHDGCGNGPDSATIMLEDRKSTRLNSSHT